MADGRTPGGTKRTRYPKSALDPEVKRGRPKGSVNKMSKTLKDMIHEAIELGGGTEVFTKFLKQYPVEFMQHLVRPMLPKNVDMTGVVGTPTTLAEFVKMQAQQSADEDSED